VKRVEGYVPLVGLEHLSEVFGPLIRRGGDVDRGGVGKPGPGQQAMYERRIRAAVIGGDRAGNTSA
jgi:hypothetical protein